MRSYMYTHAHLLCPMATKLSSAMYMYSCMCHTALLYSRCTYGLSSSHHLCLVRSSCGPATGPAGIHVSPGHAGPVGGVLPAVGLCLLRPAAWGTAISGCGCPAPQQRTRTQGLLSHTVSYFPDTVLITCCVKSQLL